MAGCPRSHDRQGVLACAVGYRLITRFGVRHGSLNAKELCEHVSTTCEELQLGSPLFLGTFRKVVIDRLSLSWRDFKKDALLYGDIISDLIRDWGITEDAILQTIALYTGGAEDATQLGRAVSSHQVHFDEEQESTSEMVLDRPNALHNVSGSNIRATRSRYSENLAPVAVIPHYTEVVKLMQTAEYDDMDQATDELAEATTKSDNHAGDVAPVPSAAGPVSGGNAVLTDRPLEDTLMHDSDEDDILIYPYNPAIDVLSWV